MLIREGEIIYDGRLDRIAEAAGDVRVVRVHLRPDGAPAPGALRALVEPLGEVVQADASVVALRVARARAPEAAAFLLQRLPVADLAIEAEEIGTLIERLLAARGRAPP